MTTQSLYDVVVVGASIAGCTAAIFFARRGLQVALIERQAVPNAYKKLCTHFIQSSATPTIKRLGFDEVIEAAGGVRNNMEVSTPWGWIRPPHQQAKGHPAYGYNIRREKLDPLLRDYAAQTPGVQLLLGQTARQLLTTQGRFTGVEIEGNGQIQ
ncbi:MAG TPA: FAD-dependent oxidoreductase, partial [Candidatus Caenarcaniphilales bacterium]